MNDQTTTVRIGGGDVTLSDGWERLDIPGADLVLAGPPTVAAADGTPFRPSFTVITADAAPGADVRTLATEAVAGTRTAVPDAQVLAYDAWPLPDGRTGRRILVTFQQEAVPLVVRQWVAVGGGTVTTVTATTSVTQHLGLEQVLDDLATQVLADSPSDPADDSGTADTSGPPAEPAAALPRLDPYLADQGLEDLSRIGPAQPFRSDGPTLARDDLEVLVRRASGAADDADDDVPAALVDAALLTADGEVTDEGRTVAALLTEPAGRLRVESGRGRTPLTLDVSVRSGLALVVATASPASLAEAPHGDDLLAAATTVTLDVVDSAAVPGVVAAWTGLAPAWSLATSPAELPEETVTSRVDAPEVPLPAGADAHLRHVWAQPWFLWTLQTGDGTGLVAVNAGAAGHLAVLRSGTADTGDTGGTGGPGGTGGTVGLQAVPSARVWSTLVATAQAVAAG